jgi:hypothetical protein
LIAVALFQHLDSWPQFLPMSEYLIECGLASLADLHPGHVSSAVSAVLRKLHTSISVTSNTAPKSRRAIRPECAPTVQTSRPFAFSAARPIGCSSRSRARHRSGWRGLAVAGVTPRAPVTPSRCSIGMSCRLLCAPLTGCGRNMPASAGKEVGRLQTCFVFHLGQS